MDRAHACHVLGVGLDATPEEARKAYKRRALETHPDKVPNGDDTLFKEVATAYAVLSGQTSHMEDLEGVAAKMFTPEFLAQVIHSILAVMRNKTPTNPMEGKDQTSASNGQTPSTSAHAANATNASNTSHAAPNKSRKPKTIHVDMKVTVEDLWKARVKKLSIKVKRQQQQQQQVLHTVYISLLNFQPMYRFKGVGDELQAGGPRGNIVVHVSVEPDLRLRMDDIICKHDLFMDKKVDLLDYYTASEFRVQLWEGVDVVVPYTRGQTCTMIEDKGLPWYDENTETERRGTLYVFFELELPDASPPVEVLTDFFSMRKRFVNEILPAIKITRHPMNDEVPSYMSSMTGPYMDPRVMKLSDLQGYQRFEFTVGAHACMVDFLKVRGLRWKAGRVDEIVQWVIRLVYFLTQWGMGAKGGRDTAPTRIHLVLANSSMEKAMPGVIECGSMSHTPSPSPSQPLHTCMAAHKTFTAFHVNSGVTVFSTPISLVYRHEEMVKVIAHELIHYLGLDFKYWDFLNEEEALAAAFPEWCRPAKGTYAGLSECFTDTIACWLMCHMLVLFGSDTWRKTSSEKAYKKQVTRVKEVQHRYLLGQAAKIIKAYSENRVDGEATHVFAYFLAKAAVFGKVESVLRRWHPKKGTRDWPAFYAYATRALKSPAFKASLPEVIDAVEPGTLRMQCIEL